MNKHVNVRRSTSLRSGPLNPTPAVQMALRWIIGQGHADRVDSPVMERYYLTHGVGREQSARAAGGLMLVRLRGLGFVNDDGVVTRAGRRAAQ